MLLSLLVSTGLEVHSHGPEAAHGSYLQGRAAHRFSPQAAHPNLPQHVEAGSETERPDCAACLYRLTTRGVQLAVSAALPVATASVMLAVLPETHPSAPCTHWSDGRSPPRA
ncbi:MAG TPA: hypothetical protein VMM92_05205 [Thermoanaerobaculia bacterium]|nr:hypothetical protein [Thermoanaerobaculia bacterium]